MSERDDKRDRYGRNDRTDAGDRAGADNGADTELNAGFRALRAEMEVSGRVPDFAAMMERAEAESDAPPGLVVGTSATEDSPPDGGGARRAVARSRRAARRLLPWIPVAAAAALAGLLLIDPPTSSADAEFERLVADYSASAAGGAWRSPTASLMRIPGVDLGTVPSFGGSLGGADLPDTDAREGRDS